jgi:hypothetical protein
MLERAAEWCSQAGARSFDFRSSLGHVPARERDMACKHSKSKDEIVQDELRVGAIAVQDLARHLAAVTAPAAALKNISENIPTCSSLARSAPSAAEIARAVSQASAVGEAM